MTETYRRQNITDMLKSAGYACKFATGYVIRYVRGGYAVIVRFDQENCPDEPTGLYLVRYAGNAILYPDKLMTTMEPEVYYPYKGVPVREFMSIVTGPVKKIEPRIWNGITKKALEALD